MQLARKPTLLTWLSLAGLAAAAFFVALQAVPVRECVLDRPDDALAFIAAQGLSLVALLAAVLAARSGCAVFLWAAALHYVVVILSVAMLYFRHSTFATAEMLFEWLILVDVAEAAPNSIFAAVLWAFAAVSVVAAVHGLAGMWLASTCRTPTREQRQDQVERRAAFSNVARIQCALIVAALISIPISIELASRREYAAVEQLQLDGARLMFVPSNRCIDWLFGTQSRVLLSGKQITDRVLTNLPRLRRLERLTLDKCTITDDGLKPLAGLRDLRTLWILGCPITDRGLAYLEPLRSVHLAGFFGDHLSAAGVKKLEAAWKHSWIVYDHRARAK